MESGLDWQLEEATVADATTASPCQRIPYLQHGSVFLTDSSSIVRYVREQSGKPFCADVFDYDLYCMANTVLDSAMGLMVFENQGLTADQSEYLTRETNRVHSGLAALNDHVQLQDILTDGLLRVGCLLEWGLYRQRFTLEATPKLEAFLNKAKHTAEFAQTSPFVAQ